jgi:hypothetical protein
MAEKKLTKKQNFEGIKAFLEVSGKSDWVEVMAHEIELLDRKSSKSGALTPAQKENIALLEVVRDILAECPNEKGMPIGEMLKDARIASFETANPNGISSQRLTGVIAPKAPMDGSGDFIREVIKKVPFYRLNYGVTNEGV